MSEVKKRSRKGAIYIVTQLVDDQMVTPDLVNDGVLVENVDLSYNPQTVTTNEFTNSLDRRARIVGGFKATLNFEAYLKGSGLPGVAPEFGRLLQACGYAEQVIATAVTGTDIAFVNASGKITAATTNITAFTVGTALHVQHPDRRVQGAYVVTAVAAGEMTVAKEDGTAPTFPDTAAGPTVTLRRGIAAATATAGSDTTATLAAPFAATDQLYRGAPLLLTGNPATPALAFVNDYTAARLAELTTKFAAPLSGSTVASIPPCVVYTPASDNLPWITVWANLDGVMVKLFGCVGSFSVEAQAGGAAKLKFSMSGLYHSEIDQAPGATAYDATRPAIWRNSVFEVNRRPIGTSKLMIDTKSQVEFPPNPNGGEGFDPPIIISREMTGSIDPNLSTVATQDIMTAFRAGETQPIHARLTGGPGAVPGNRVGMVVPAAQYSDAKPTDRNGVRAREIPFDCTREDGGFMLAFY